MKLVKDTDRLPKRNRKISDATAEEAVRTIIQWIGEDPEREGLKSTPKRVINAFKEYFQGYDDDPSHYLQKTFTDVEGYDVGGKTGTAELLNEFGQYNKDANRTLFIGAFPMSDPKYLVLSVINNPKKIKEENYSITGATVNAPLVKNIILRMIEILNIRAPDFIAV